MKGIYFLLFFVDVILTIIFVEYNFYASLWLGILLYVVYFFSNIFLIFNVMKLQKMRGIVVGILLLCFVVSSFSEHMLIGILVPTLAVMSSKCEKKSKGITISAIILSVIMLLGGSFYCLVSSFGSLSEISRTSNGNIAITTVYVDQGALGDSYRFYVEYTLLNRCLIAEKYVASDYDPLEIEWVDDVTYRIGEQKYTVRSILNVL